MSADTSSKKAQYNKKFALIHLNNSMPVQNGEEESERAIVLERGNIK